MSTGTTALGQSYEHMMVFLNTRADKVQLSDQEEEDLQKAHRTNINKLVGEGKILSAGPFDGGGGIFILSTGSLAEARVWLETDPAVQAGRWNIEMHPFILVKGKICNPFEPIEMVSYHFIRFTDQNEIANFKTSSSSNTAADLSLIGRLHSRGSLLLACSFANSSGGVIIYRGEDKSAWLNDDPLVSSGTLSIDTKQLWIAKGSFCEN